MEITNAPELEPFVGKVFRRFGTNLNLKKTVFETIKSNEYGCCQIFLTDRKSYLPRSISKEEKEDIRDYCLKNDKTCYVHCPYEINMASKDDGIRSRGKNSVIENLKQTLDFPCSCVVHVGAKGNVQTVAKEINDILIPTGKFSQCPLLLENSSGKGTSLGRNVEEFRVLYEHLDRSNKKVGICVDTQHLFSSGLCDFSNHESVVKMYEDFSSVAEVGMIHINDSMVPFGNRADRHESIGNGYIWPNRSFDSLASLLSICQEKRIDTVMETYIDPESVILLNKLYSEI